MKVRAGVRLDRRTASTRLRRERRDLAIGCFLRPDRRPLQRRRRVEDPVGIRPARCSQRLAPSERWPRSRRRETIPRGVPSGGGKLGRPLREAGIRLEGEGDDGGHHATAAAMSARHATSPPMRSVRLIQRASASTSPWCIASHLSTIVLVLLSIVSSLVRPAWSGGERDRSLTNCHPMSNCQWICRGAMICSTVRVARLRGQLFSTVRGPPPQAEPSCHDPSCSSSFSLPHAVARQKQEDAKWAPDQETGMGCSRCVSVGEKRAGMSVIAPPQFCVRRCFWWPQGRARCAGKPEGTAAHGRG